MPAKKVSGFIAAPTPCADAILIATGFSVSRLAPNLPPPKKSSTTHGTDLNLDATHQHQALSLVMTQE